MTVDRIQVGRLPPTRVLRLAAVLVAVILGVALVGLWWGGPPVAVAAALGAVSVLVLSLQRPPWSHVAWLAGAVAVGAALATRLADAPVLLGLVTALSVLATLPVVLRYGAVTSTTAVVVAAAGTEVSSIGPAAAAGGVLLGAGLLTLVMRRLVRSATVPARPGRAVLVAYVVALATGSGIAIALARGLDVGHAMWVVVALSAVLVPVAGETTRQARLRVVGTVIGVLVASVVASLVPQAVDGVLAAGCLLLGIAWVLVGDQTRGSAFMAALLVLVAASAQSGAAWGVAAQRAGLTLVGALVAVVLGLAVARLDRDLDDDRGPGR